MCSENEATGLFIVSKAVSCISSGLCLVAGEPEDIPVLGTKRVKSVSGVFEECTFDELC